MFSLLALNAAKLLWSNTAHWTVPLDLCSETVSAGCIAISSVGYKYQVCQVCSLLGWDSEKVSSAGGSYGGSNYRYSHRGAGHDS